MVWVWLLGQSIGGERVDICPPKLGTGGAGKIVAGKGVVVEDVICAGKLTGVMASLQGHKQGIGPRSLMF